jgi:SAM-dependent methyltransferase
MYGAEFAEIYDMVYASRGKDYQQEAKYVAELIRGASPDARSLLDVGCATGAHLVCFGEMFDHVEGVELSADMVAVARAKFTGDVVHQGDMRTFRLSRTFDAITCMFGTIGHAETETELTETLRRFESHLAPGGVVVVDPWWFPETFTPGYVAGDVCQIGDRTVARVSHATRDGGSSRMTVHYVIAEPVTGIRSFEEVYLARLFPRETYEQAFLAAGLSAEYIEGVQSGRGAFVAVRPG